MRGKVRIKTVHKITNVNDKQNVDDQKKRGKSRNISGVETQKRKSNRFQKKKNRTGKKITKTRRKPEPRENRSSARPIEKKNNRPVKKRRIFRSGISNPPNQNTAKQKTGRKIQIPPDFFVVPTCMLLSFEISEMPNRSEWR